VKIYGSATGFVKHEPSQEANDSTCVENAQSSIIERGELLVAEGKRMAQLQQHRDAYTKYREGLQCLMDALPETEDDDSTMTSSLRKVINMYLNEVESLKLRIDDEDENKYLQQHVQQCEDIMRRAKFFQEKGLNDDSCREARRGLQFFRSMLRYLVETSPDIKSLHDKIAVALGESECLAKQLRSAGLTVQILADGSLGLRGTAAAGEVGENHSMKSAGLANNLPTSLNSSKEILVKRELEEGQWLSGVPAWSKARPTMRSHVPEEMLHTAWGASVHPSTGAGVAADASIGNSVPTISTFERTPQVSAPLEASLFGQGFATPNLVAQKTQTNNPCNTAHPMQINRFSEGLVSPCGPCP